MNHDPERCPWFFVPLTLVCLLAAYAVVQNIDDWTDARLRGLPADYAQR